MQYLSLAGLINAATPFVLQHINYQLSTSFQLSVQVATSTLNSLTINFINADGKLITHQYKIQRQTIIQKAAN